MRIQPPAAFFLSLLLTACAVEDGNEAANVAPPATDESTPAPSASPPPRQPANDGQAPERSAVVTLAVAPESTSPDSTVTLTLRNGAQQQIGYNLCTSALETGAGRPVPTSRICTMELRTLEPGRTATHRYELPVNMVDGSYRFMTQVHWLPSKRTSAIRSNSLEVSSD